MPPSSRYIFEELLYHLTRSVSLESPPGEVSSHPATHPSHIVVALSSSAEGG